MGDTSSPTPTAVSAGAHSPLNPQIVPSISPKSDANTSTARGSSDNDNDDQRVPSTPTPHASRTAPSAAATAAAPRPGRPLPNRRMPLTPIEQKFIDPRLNILPDNTLKSFAAHIRANACTRIIILTGAGISTSAGIPDFRSPGTGLYDNLQKYNLPYPEAVFDIAFYRRRPQAFCALAKELFPGEVYKPTVVHRFLRALADHQLLLRNFTQNIDMLERLAGVPETLLVEAHGSFSAARCVGGVWPPLETRQPANAPSSDTPNRDGGDTAGSDGVESDNDSDTTDDDDDGTHGGSHKGCGRPHPIESVRQTILSGDIPQCTHCGGLVKPDIVFFGESLPTRFYDLVMSDFRQCDALITIGTSLQVQPFAGLINLVKPTVPRLLINREACGDMRSPSRGFDFTGDVQKYRRDALFLGSCDDGVAELARELGIVIPDAPSPSSALAVEEGQANSSGGGHGGDASSADSDFAALADAVEKIALESDQSHL